jgi:hypothetical protein
MVYTEPVADLPSFDELRSVPTIQSSLGITDYTTLAEDIAELQHGHGDRACVSTLTFTLDKELLNFAYDIFVQEASPISHYIRGTMEFHAVPRTLEPADNVYGLTGAKGPLISFLLIFSTSHEQYDAEVIATQQRILEKVKEEAEKRGLYHPFLFANYAGQWQDVVGSYGASNVEYLSEVSKRYDPEQVFQRLHSGSFKANGTPAGHKL